MQIIALIGDNCLTSTPLIMALRAEGYDTQTFTDGTAALSAMNENSPDAVVLDTESPSINAMEFLRRLRQESNLPVILVSSNGDEIDELFGLKLGADDYMRKPLSLRVLMERINAVLRRVQLRQAVDITDTETQIIDRGKLFIDFERRLCRWRGTPINLTVKEFLLLWALTKDPGSIWNRVALTEATCCGHAPLDERSIDSHIKRLRQKLRRADENFDAIETLYGVGYRFRKV